MCAALALSRRPAPTGYDRLNPSPATNHRHSQREGPTVLHDVPVVAAHSHRSSADEMPLPMAEPTVIYRPMPDGGVVFHPGNEFYYGLNLTSACIWENLAPVCSSLDELCDAVDKRFPGIDPQRIRADALGLLEKLFEHALVVSV